MAQHELKMDPKKPLSVALSGAFRDMVDYARSRAAQAKAAPEAAVHDFRRSLRRAGAQLKLTRPFLNKDGAAWMREALNKAFKKTGALRDHGVLLPTLDAIRDRLSVPGAADRLRELLRAEKAKAEGRKVPEVLAKNVRFLKGLGETYQAALQDKVSEERLREALRASYAKAREAYRKVLDSRDERDLHRWRKAVKAVRYQLELLTSRGDEGLQAARQAFITQAKQLGEITDLMALRDFVKDARSQLDGFKPKRVVADIEAAIKPRVEAAIASAKETYETSAKRFARPGRGRGKGKAKGAEAAVEPQGVDAAVGAPAADAPEAAPPPTAAEPEAATRQGSSTKTAATKTASTKQASTEKATASKKASGKKASTKKASSKKTTASKKASGKKTTSKKTTASKKASSKKASTKKTTASKKASGKKASSSEKADTGPESTGGPEGASEA